MDDRTISLYILKYFAQKNYVVRFMINDEYFPSLHLLSLFLVEDAEFLN